MFGIVVRQQHPPPRRGGDGGGVRQFVRRTPSASQNSRLLIWDYVKYLPMPTAVFYIIAHIDSRFVVDVRYSKRLRFPQAFGGDSRQTATAPSPWGELGGNFRSEDKRTSTHRRPLQRPRAARRKQTINTSKPKAAPRRPPEEDGRHSQRRGRPPRASRAGAPSLLPCDTT